MRGRLHQIAFFVSIPAGIALIALANGAARISVAAIYAASLTAVFGVSAAYHRGSWGPVARRRMRCLDHSMIFVLIAGSYTPITIIALEGPWQIVLLSVAWAGAAAGVAMKLAKPDGLSITTSALYLCLGWAAMLALPRFVEALSGTALTLLLAGGLLYSIGALVFAIKRPDPRPAVFGYHEIWHAFMVTAAACHFALVLLLVRG